MRLKLWCFASLLTLTSCGHQDTATKTEMTEPTVSTPNTFTFNWTAIADKLMERMDVQPGEKVMMVARPGEFDPLIPLLRQRIKTAGATDLGVFSVTGQSPEGWQTGFTRQAESMDRQALVSYFDEVDLGIMLPGPTPTDAAYGAMQDVLRKNKGRTVHFHWAGAYDLQLNVLPITADINAHYQKALLETDYQQLSAAQRRVEEAMRGKTIQVTTPAGTDIRFQIGDRPVTKQDGDASAARMQEARNLIDREVELPAGAIRVAPIENTVNGSIAFPPSEWNGQIVEGLVMHFQNGKLTDWNADSGREAVEAILQSGGESARSFREFALGLNPMLTLQTNGKTWIPYYGYGAGIVRLSLGDNTELGGQVGGGFVRWNFFTDATVKIGDEIWVKDGKLLK